MLAASCFSVSDATAFSLAVGLFFSLDDLGSSDGNLGRDFLIGFFTWSWLGVLASVSRLSLAGRAPFSLDSALGEAFFRPSFGDFGLVVGIYITEFKIVRSIKVYDGLDEIISEVTFFSSTFGGGGS